jgi:acetyl-CoA synthetase
MTTTAKRSVYPIAPKLSSDKYPRPHYDSFEKYKEDHLLSITKPQEFWSKVELLIQLYYSSINSIFFYL